MKKLANLKIYDFDSFIIEKIQITKRNNPVVDFLKIQGTFVIQFCSFALLESFLIF